MLEDEAKKVEQKEPRPRPQSVPPQEEVAAVQPKRKIVNKVSPMPREQNPAAVAVAGLQQVDKVETIYRVTSCRVKPDIG